MARALDQAIRRLEEAMAMLTQKQAWFLAHAASMDRLFAELQRINAVRFARIEAILLEHSRILAEHTHILSDHGRILQALTDAVLERIGFKMPEQAGAGS